ncbi:MAG: DUF3194 domain-containing protein [Candidatus Lokiarchaeota archaeon]|nr:DUF3194 domain-containing protein [Candidatus Lokiarchaeota archaeon]
MNKNSLIIGLPELNEDQLIELIKHVDDSIRKYILSEIDIKFIDDFNVKIFLDKKEELSLIIDLELTFFIYIPNAESVLKTALQVGVNALQKKIYSFK